MSQPTIDEYRAAHSVDDLLSEWFTKEILAFSDSDDNNTIVYPSWPANQETSGGYTRVAERGSLFAFVLNYGLFATTPNQPRIVWSDDGVNAATFLGSPLTTNIPLQSSEISPGVTAYYGIVVVNAPFIRAKYYKIVSKNGASLTSFYYAIAGVGRYPAAGSIGAVTDPINQLTVVQNVRSIISGFESDGTPRNVGVTSKGRLKTDSGQDFDMFGGLHISETTDFVSVVFNNTADMDTSTVSLAANGGSESVVSNNLVVSSGTATNGTAGRRSKSEIIYSPGHEGRAQFTTVFNPTTAGARQLIGFITEDSNNGLYLEDDGTGLFITHMRGGVQSEKIAFASWNGDLNNDYTLDGEVIDVDFLTGRVWRLRFGYLGYAGLILELRSPDGDWIVAHTIKYESETVPLFTTTRLPLTAKVVKISGSTDIVLKSASWQAAVFGESKSPLIASENSSTTALGTSATKSGMYISHEGYVSLEIIIATDQVSATDGIVISFSDRGDTGAVARTQRKETFSDDDVTAGYKTIIVEPRLSFTKVDYGNGGVAQGSFFMQTRLHKQSLELPRGSLEASVSSTNTALMTRGAILAKTDAGGYGNILRSLLGGLRVSLREQEIELQQKSCSTHRCDRLNVTTGAAQQLDTTKLTNRKYITISNNDATKGVCYGTVSSLSTSSQSIDLPAGSAHQQEWDASLDVYCISTSGTANVSLSQTAGTV